MPRSDEDNASEAEEQGEVSTRAGTRRMQLRVLARLTYMLSTLLT